MPAWPMWIEMHSLMVAGEEGRSKWKRRKGFQR